MVNFSKNLTQTLERAAAEAKRRKHEFATLEHLLLALIDDPDAANVLEGCKVDQEKLRQDLVQYVDNDLHSLVLENFSGNAVVTASVQRSLQRATIKIQSKGHGDVTGANVLLAIFSERESQAAYFLQEQGMTRYDAVNFMEHGHQKPASAEEKRAEARAKLQEKFSPVFLATMGRVGHDAKARAHNEATPEHLLLGLIDDPDAADVLIGCGVDYERLRQDVSSYLDTLPGTEGDIFPRPNAAFTKIFLGASNNMPSGEKATGADVLIELLRAYDSPAVSFLRKQDMSRFDAINYSVHGITKPPKSEEQTAEEKAAREKRSLRRMAMIDRKMAKLGLLEPFA
jgi:ATP-dependent Clp protease ATP-binding subunit ClpA